MSTSGRQPGHAPSNQSLCPPATQLTVYSKSSMSKLTHEESCGEMQLRACCQMFCHGTGSTRNYSEACARAACRAPRPPHLSTAKDCPAHSLSIRLVRCFFCSHIAGALLYLSGNKAEPALLIWPPTRTLNLGSAGRKTPCCYVLFIIKEGEASSGISDHLLDDPEKTHC